MNVKIEETWREQLGDEFDKQYFVSLNKETNRLVSMPAESVTGPKDNMIAGVRLDQNQIILVGVSESLFTMYLYAI